MTPDTETMDDRVEHLVHPHDERPLAWGNPLLSTTPAPIAIHDLAERVEVLEEAVRGIALHLEQLDNAG